MFLDSWFCFFGSVFNHCVIICLGGERVLTWAWLNAICISHLERLEDVV